MGQSKFNKKAIKTKEYGASDKGKLTGEYKAVIIVLSIAVIAFLLFSILLATEAISCAGSDSTPQTNQPTVSSGDVIAMGANGEELRIRIDPETNAASYYFIDENGKDVECTVSEDGTQLSYIDADGNTKIFEFATTSGSDVSGTDVSGTDVASPADAQ